MSLVPDECAGHEARQPCGGVRDISLVFTSIMD